MLVNEAHLTISEIALIGVVATIINTVLQLPAGYLADKFGNRKTMLFGTILSLPATLFYVFWPSFWGALIGLGLYVIGLIFINGAGEALVHDTLHALGRAKDYVKEVGRAQSIALGGNFVLIALVPLTYALDHRLPFIIGFACAFLLVVSIYKMVEPTRHHAVATMSPISALKKVLTRKNIILFLFAGLAGGVVERVFDFLTLALVQVGIDPALTGMVVAISSVIGAVMGWYLFIFDKLKPAWFYFVDLVLVCLLFGLCGVQNVVVVVASFVLLLGYIRVRFIVFQSKLFKDIDHAYKATLISALSLFSVFGGIFTMLLFGRISTVFGFMLGLQYFAATTFVVGLALLLLVVASGSSRIKPSAS